MELWLESVFSLSPTKFLIIKVGFVLLSHLKCLLNLHCIIRSKTHLIYRLQRLQRLNGLPISPMTQKHSLKQPLLNLDQTVNIFPDKQYTADPKQRSTGISWDYPALTLCLFISIHLSQREDFDTFPSLQFDSTISAVFAFRSQRSLCADSHV